jgi:hypothetical protein
MGHPNFMTPLQHDILSPLVGKIATGFKFEQTPDPQRFSDKLTVRLRVIDRYDSEVLLGIHTKQLGNAADSHVSLNVGINLLITENADPRESILGFEREQQLELQELLRQPLNSVYLLKNRSLVLRFSHQALRFEASKAEGGVLALKWEVYT